MYYSIYNYTSANYSIPVNKTILIIDFDSTLVSVESLDLLAEIVLRVS